MIRADIYASEIIHVQWTRQVYLNMDFVHHRFEGIRSLDCKTKSVASPNSIAKAHSAKPESN